MLILIIVLIIFGAGKLPQLGEGLGKAIKGFKKTVHEADAIDVETQAFNLVTIGFYHGLGFLPVRARYALHVSVGS